MIGIGPTNDCVPPGTNWSPGQWSNNTNHSDSSFTIDFYSPSHTHTQPKLEYHKRTHPRRNCITHNNTYQPYGVPRPQWVDTLWPSDAIWRHRFGSILVQAMACCLAAPSHNLNQYWFAISQVSRYSPQENFTENAQDSYSWCASENHKFTITSNYLRGLWANIETAINYANKKWHQDYPYRPSLLMNYRYFKLWQDIWRFGAHTIEWSLMGLDSWSITFSLKASY